MTLTWYRHFYRNDGLNQILKRQTSRSHYGSMVPAVTITVFKYWNEIGKIVVKVDYIWMISLMYFVIEKQVLDMLVHALSL